MARSRALQKTPDDTPHAPYPVALRSAPLLLGDTTVECHVLDTGGRVLSLRSAGAALLGREDAHLGRLLSGPAFKPFVDIDILLGQIQPFRPVRGPFLGHGIAGEDFIGLCEAIWAAHRAGALRRKAHVQIAMRAASLTMGAARIGIVAMIDEATGAQVTREPNALQVHFARLFNDTLSEWEKQFPDEWWALLAKLTGFKGDYLRHRPWHWGKYVNEFIYCYIDPAIPAYMREHHPPPCKGQNWHQYLTETVGLPKLGIQLLKALTVGKTCVTMSDFRESLALAMDKPGAQYRMLPLLRDPKTDHNRDTGRREAA